jgi:hypothetical protein
MMTARRGDLQGATSEGLSSYLGKVKRRIINFGGRFGHRTARDLA